MMVELDYCGSKGHSSFVLQVLYFILLLIWNAAEVAFYLQNNQTSRILEKFFLVFNINLKQSVLRM